jgi:endo-1,4-beta-D-glucanase Y
MGIGGNGSGGFGSVLGVAGGSRVGSGGSPPSCAGGVAAPASTGAAFPFPQHRTSAVCLYAQRCADLDVTVAWEKYKTRLVVDGGNGSLRVQRPENQNDTVSEGIGYGMLFAVYLNDKATFDRLWQYANLHLDGPDGLMNWRVNADGSTGGGNSATDADEDMGFALVMADKQWGGYATVAKNLLARISMSDFSSDGTVRGGDEFGDVNPSYLAPAFYKVFATYTGDARWMTIVDRSYAILGGATNSTTGLVPDWSTGSRGSNYTYDATRTPYRIAVDACWFADTRARAFSDKIAAFFALIGAANIKDGYRLDGTVIGLNMNATFIGPAGVAAMAGNRQTLLDDAYLIVSETGRAGTDSYYNLSWALLSSLMMTGNFVNFIASPGLP